jgi:hypothetical protein
MSLTNFLILFLIKVSVSVSITVEVIVNWASMKSMDHATNRNMASIEGTAKPR